MARKKGITAGVQLTPKRFRSSRCAMDGVPIRYMSTPAASNKCGRIGRRTMERAFYDGENGAARFNSNIARGTSIFRGRRRLRHRLSITRREPR